MKFEKLFYDYVLNSELYWPSTHERNIKKINSFIRKGCSFRNENKKTYIDNILRLSHLRSGFDYTHFYLVNAGSSGSHWVEAMLSLLPGFHNGGEIYFPKKIKETLSSWNQSQAEMFIDAVYLVHSGAIYKDSLFSALSNSAHLADHHQISKYSKKKLVVLLLRDPVDIVLSRTFRKDEYKHDISPMESDKEYLEKNCRYVEKFYQGLNFNDFDLIVRYEDFLDSPKNHLSKLADLLKLNAFDSDIDNAVVKTSKSEVKKSLVKGVPAITNIYLDEKKDHVWARNYVKERLSDVVKQYDNS